MGFDKAAYDGEYMKNNIRQFSLKANKIHDIDIIQWLESKENMQSYLKDLIRTDIENHARTRSE